MLLARRAQTISGSASLALIARVAEMRAQGIDVISLAAGEPDFPSPPEAIAAANAFIAQGHVRYTPSSGIPELRAAAARNLGQTTGVDYEPGQVIVTCGAKEALALAILVLCQAGDEVLVLCSPGNPTGAVYTREEFAALADVLAGTGVTVLSDEIYWPFVYEGAFVSPAGLPGMAERTIVVNGVSKGWSMTGWRIGWLGAPRPVGRRLLRLPARGQRLRPGPPRRPRLCQGAARTATRGRAARHRVR